MQHFFISHTFGQTDLHPFPAHFKTFRVFLICFPKYPSFSTTEKQCSKCSIALVSSLSTVCFSNESCCCLFVVVVILVVVECQFCHSKPEFNFPCASCIIYHAPSTVSIFHILQFFFFSPRNFTSHPLIPMWVLANTKRVDVLEAPIVFSLFSFKG